MVCSSWGRSCSSWAVLIKGTLGEAGEAEVEAGGVRLEKGGLAAREREGEGWGRLPTDWGILPTLWAAAGPLGLCSPSIPGMLDFEHGSRWIQRSYWSSGECGVGDGARCRSSF